MAAFCGEGADPKIAKWRSDTLRDLGDLISDLIRDKDRGVEKDLTLDVLLSLAQMPLDWKSCDRQLARYAKPLLEREGLETLVPLLQGAVKSLPHSRYFADLLTSRAQELFRRGAPDLVADALDAMVAGALALDAVPRALERVLGSAPFETVVSVLAGLGERSAEGKEMRVCAEYVGAAGRASSLEALPPSTLLRLTVAATKSSVLAEYALDGVASAAAITLPGWSMDDASKLLLAVAKTRGNAGEKSSGVARLYTRASEVLAPKLKEFSGVQLIKVLLAVSQMPACRSLLEAGAAEAAESRLPDLPMSQLVLLTQALLPLGGDDAALGKLLDFWASTFTAATRAEVLLTDSMGEEMVASRRKDLEAKGQLTADQVAHLADTVAPKVPECDKFWNALASRFIGEDEFEGLGEELTAAGKKSLEAAFPKGGGPQFSTRSEMLEAAFGLRKHKKERDRIKKRKKKEAAKEKDRDDGRERSKHRKPTDGAAVEAGAAEGSDSPSESGGEVDEKEMAHREEMRERRQKAKAEAARAKAVELQEEMEHRMKQQERRAKLPPMAIEVEVPQTAEELRETERRRLQAERRRGLRGNTPVAIEEDDVEELLLPEGATRQAKKQRRAPADRRRHVDVEECLAEEVLIPESIELEDAPPTQAGRRRLQAERRKARAPPLAAAAPEVAVQLDDDPIVELS